MTTTSRTLMPESMAEDAGVSAVALHGRTQNQHYSGTADWDAIRTLKETVTSIPVLGNGRYLVR